MKYRLEIKDDVNLVFLEGRLLGEHQVYELKDLIRDKIEEGFSNVIIDLSGLEYINSTGLNFLLNVLTMARKEGGEVILNALNDQLTKLLIMTKLNSFFIITDQLEESFKHFSSSEALPK